MQRLDPVTMRSSPDHSRIIPCFSPGGSPELDLLFTMAGEVVY